VHRYLSSNQIFQVANLRILLIALGSRVLFKRRLSLLQYLGIVLLAAACSIRTARARARPPPPARPVCTRSAHQSRDVALLGGPRHFALPSWDARHSRCLPRAAPRCHVLRRLYRERAGPRAAAGARCPPGCARRSAGPSPRRAPGAGRGAAQ
jgi:hypothetical protein